MRKNNFALIFLLVFVSFILLITGCSGELGDFQKAKKQFQEDRDSLTLVATYLAEREEDSLQIESDTGELKSYANTDTVELKIETVVIEDETVKNAIQQLIAKEYYAISKNENTIVFYRWQGVESGSGFTYSIDGVSTPTVQFCTKLEALSENSWFYFEENYNEWRNSQTS